MSDSPLAVRVNDETKALFNELAEREEFTNKGDFLSRLLIQYQAAAMKENASVLAPAVEAVETLTGRLFEVLTGAAAMITTAEEKHRQENEDRRISFEETRTLLQQRITFMEQERIENEARAAALMADRDAADGKASELQQQIKQLEGTVKDKTDLVEEYRGKNDTLNGIILEYKAAADENKALVESVNAGKHVSEQQQREIDELKRELQRQADSLKTEMENLKNSLLLQKDTALLELRQELQVKAEEQQSRYAAAIDELHDKHATVVTGYENKVRDLLNLLERGKSATPANKRTLKEAPTSVQNKTPEE